MTSTLSHSRFLDAGIFKFQLVSSIGQTKKGKLIFLAAD